MSLLQMQTGRMTEQTRLTRTQSQEQTRRSLLDAARLQIAEQGVTAASVRNISEASGHSQGAFYAHFGSKEAMLLEVLREHLDIRAGRFEDLASAIGRHHQVPGSKADAIAAVRAYLKESPDPKWAVLAVELLLHAGRSPDLRDEYETVRFAFQDRLGKATTRLFEQLRLRPPCPPAQIAKGLISMSVGFAIQGGTMASEERLAVLVAFFAGMIEASDVI